MMIFFTDPSKCSGCTACMHSCPEGAIQMVPDMEGFLYPKVNQERCKDCGACIAVCPFHDRYDTKDNFNVPLVFAAKHKVDEIRETSTSGGLFTAISDYVLSKKGLVYGAGFDESFQVCHQKAETFIQRDKFKGSKYTQSNLGNTFIEIRKELDQGRVVLFTGTPCQNAGLKAFIGEVPKELILCDLICLGTPSPKIWKDFVISLEMHQGSKLKEFSFRDKSAGWHTPRPFAIFADGSKLCDGPFLNAFTNIFYQRLALRPSCHACPFSNVRRVSDITLADFWGIEDFYPDFDDNKGVSLLLVNTPKGKFLFDAIKSDVYSFQAELEEAVKKQTHLKRPAIPSPLRQHFWRDYYSYGFEYVIQKYAIPTRYQKFKNSILIPFLKNIGLFNSIRTFIKRNDQAPKVL